MKRISELTRQQLVELTEEEVASLIKLECAHEGVRLLDPPKEFVAHSPEPRDGYFEISHIGLSSRTREPLEKILDLVRSVQNELVETTYDYKLGYNRRYVEKTDDREFAIVFQRCFLRKDLEDNRVEFEKQKQEKEEHEKYVKEYEETRKTLSAIAEEVWLKVNEAHRIQSRIGFLKNKFEEYVELAGGDREQARKFFDKAYGSEDQNQIQEALGEINGTTKSNRS